MACEGTGCKPDWLVGARRAKIRVSLLVFGLWRVNLSLGNRGLGLPSFLPFPARFQGEMPKRELCHGWLR